MEFVSEGCLLLTGYTQAELTINEDVKYGDLIHPDDRDLVWKTVQEAITKNTHFELDYRIITKEGKELWVRERGQAVKQIHDDQIFLEGFIADVTKRKKIEEELVAHRQNLENIVEEKTRDLQRTVNLMAGREIRMMELKNEIKKLKKQLNDA
jgi:PAS domain S-box-containing protein